MYIPVVLSIIFAVLKCLNIITWSWWLVIGPLWIPVAATVSIMLVVYGCMTLFIYISR